MQSGHGSSLVGWSGLLEEPLSNQSARWPKSVGAFSKMARIRRLLTNLHRETENERAHSVLCRLALVREGAVRF